MARPERAREQHERMTTGYPDDPADTGWLSLARCRSAETGWGASERLSCVLSGTRPGIRLLPGSPRRC